MIGSIGVRSTDDPLEQFDLRHFELQTSVYDTSKSAPIQFSVVCFFENGRRWQKVKIPSSGSYIGVTAKIVGRTTETNCLALRVLDLAYLPRSTDTTTSAPNLTPTPTSKRSNRWVGRVDSSTPTKKQKLETEAKPADSSEDNSTTMAQTTPHTPTGSEKDDLQLDATGLEHLNDSPSPHHDLHYPEPTDLGLSSASSIPSQPSDSGSRPQRIRRRPKTFGP
jgi:hypothetical protein